jgi:hypothetical protein
MWENHVGDVVSPERADQSIEYRGGGLQWGPPHSPLQEENLKMEEKKSDLTYGTNRGWVIKLALIWTLLMVPSQIAQLVGDETMDTVLTLLGMVGFFILFFQGLNRLAGVVSLREFQELKLGYPWGLIIGLMAWHFSTTTMVFFLLMGAFEPTVVIGGSGGTPG